MVGIIFRLKIPLVIKLKNMISNVKQAPESNKLFLTFHFVHQEKQERNVLGKNKHSLFINDKTITF